MAVVALQACLHDGVGHTGTACTTHFSWLAKNQYLLRLRRASFPAMKAGGHGLTQLMQTSTTDNK